MVRLNVKLEMTLRTYTPYEGHWVVSALPFAWACRVTIVIHVNPVFREDPICAWSPLPSSGRSRRRAAIPVHGYGTPVCSCVACRLSAAQRGAFRVIPPVDGARRLEAWERAAPYRYTIAGADEGGFHVSRRVRCVRRCFRFRHGRPRFIGENATLHRCSSCFGTGVGAISESQR